MEEFERAEENEDLITFEPEDFYYRRSTPVDANAWSLAIYAFAVETVPPLRFQGTQGVMQYQLSPISAGVPGSIVELKVIHLLVEKLYLGLYVERWIGRWPVKSGWSLHGPGDFTRYQPGYVLQAIYPRDVIPVEGRGSLDRNDVEVGSK